MQISLPSERVFFLWNVDALQKSIDIRRLLWNAQIVSGWLRGDDPGIALSYHYCLGDASILGGTGTTCLRQAAPSISSWLPGSTFSRRERKGQ